MRIEIVRGNDIHHREFLHLVGMIQRHPPPHAASAVVAHHAELAVSQVLHHFDAIQRHRPLGLLE